MHGAMLCLGEMGGSRSGSEKESFLRRNGTSSGMLPLEELHSLGERRRCRLEWERSDGDEGPVRWQAQRTITGDLHSRVAGETGSRRQPGGTSCGLDEKQEANARSFSVGSATASNSQLMLFLDPTRSPVVAASCSADCSPDFPTTMALPRLPNAPTPRRSPPKGCGGLLELPSIGLPSLTVSGDPGDSPKPSS
eukprot:scaffold229946_cov28-Tisochrysis_lutea.AAC.4